MTSQRLERTAYLPPGALNPTGATTHEESYRDADSYDRPLEQVHLSGVHGVGVAGRDEEHGLRVIAVRNKADLQVLAGVAVDIAGKHISLAEGGQAEVGPDAD